MSYSFVGRDAEQQAFAATLEELAAGGKRWLFGKAQPSKKQARVFLTIGSVTILHLRLSHKPAPDAPEWIGFVRTCPADHGFSGRPVALQDSS